MLIMAIVLFAFAALLGLYLLSYVLRDKETPKAVAFIHGPVAATGLILLIIYAYYHSPSPWVSIILFALAAMGGLMLIYKDLTGHPVPKALALGHGITAIVAFIFLLKFVFLP
jgi:hypothetical protein